MLVGGGFVSEGDGWLEGGLHPEHRHHDCGNVYFDDVELAHFDLEDLNEPGRSSFGSLK